MSVQTSLHAQQMLSVLFSVKKKGQLNCTLTKTDWSLQGARSLQNVTSWCAEMGATWLTKKAGVCIHLWTFVLVKVLFYWACSSIVAAGKKKHGASQEQQTLFYFVVSKHSTFASLLMKFYPNSPFCFVVICQSPLIPDLTDASYIYCLNGHLDFFILSRSCWSHQ